MKKFFSRKKDQDQEPDVPHLTESDLSETNTEDIIPSLSNPESSRGFDEGKEKTKMLKISLALIIIVTIFLFVSGYQFFLSLKNISKPAGTESKITTDDAERQRLLDEQKELQEKVRILSEQNMEKDSKIELIERKLNTILDSVGKSDSSEIIDEIRKTQSTVSSMKQSIDEVYARLDSVEKRPIGIIGELPQGEDLDAVSQEPEIGSQEPTQILNRISVFTENKEKEEEEAKNKVVEAPSVDKRPGLQVGLAIPAVTTTKILSSSNLENFYATVVTVQDYDLGNRLILPKGTKFLGKVVPDFDSRRLIVNIERLQYGDTDIKCKGIILDKNGSPGLVSKYVDPFYRGIWLSMLPSLISIPFMSDSNNVSWKGDSGEKITETDPKNEMLSQIAVTTTEKLAEKAMEGKPLIIMDSNLPVQVQITEKLPIDLLLEGGVVTQKRRIYRN